MVDRLRGASIQWASLAAGRYSGVTAGRLSMPVLRSVMRTASR
jgi:hypothetical protein